MRKLKIFSVFIFWPILTIFGCTATHFPVYSRESGYLPVSLANRDATVVVKSLDIQNNKVFEIQGSGSAIFQDKDGGYILTAQHIVSKPDNTNYADTCVALNLNKKCHSSMVVAKDQFYDLAVVYTVDIKFKKTVKLGVNEKFYKPGRIIYNWGFPESYEKSLGYGYISAPATSEPSFGPGLRLLGQLPDGEGTSGSGIFDGKTHLLIGIMQGFSIPSPDSRHTVCYFIPSTYIKKFLDENKISYRLAK
jgi:S1-C subfamily serine protease